MPITARDEGLFVQRWFEPFSEPGKQALSLWGKRMWVRAGAPRHLSARLNGRLLTFPTGRAVVVTSRGFQRVRAA